MKDFYGFIITRKEENKRESLLFHYNEGETPFPHVYCDLLQLYWGWNPPLPMCTAFCFNYIEGETPLSPCVLWSASIIMRVKPLSPCVLRSALIMMRLKPLSPCVLWSASIIMRVNPLSPCVLCSASTKKLAFPIIWKE